MTVLVLLEIYIYKSPIPYPYVGERSGRVAAKPYKSYIAKIFNVYENYVNALDYSIYGYHNINSIFKSFRSFSYIHGFKEEKGNALFLFTSGLFGSLFGPKGFVYNSPFLIFSILGIFSYKQKEKKNFLALTIILFLVLFGFFNFYWYGGVTPRYVRHFQIPILLLSFFSFYCLQ